MLDCRLRSHGRSRGIWATGGCGTDCLHTARISGRSSKREETKASHGPCSVGTLVRHEAVFIPAAEDPRSWMGEGMYYLWAPCSAAQREMLSHSPLSIVGRRQWFLSHDDPQSTFRAHLHLGTEVALPQTFLEDPPVDFPFTKSHIEASRWLRDFLNDRFGCELAEPPPMTAVPPGRRMESIAAKSTSNKAGKKRAPRNTARSKQFFGTSAREGVLSMTFTLPAPCFLVSPRKNSLSPGGNVAIRKDSPIPSFAIAKTVPQKGPISMTIPSLRP